MLKIIDLPLEIMNHILTNFIIKKKENDTKINNHALYWMLLIILSSKYYNKNFSNLIQNYSLYKIKCNICNRKDVAIYYNKSKKYFGGECYFCWNFS